MSNSQTLDDYEVGYGRPPKSTQFRKGASGNPKGRPKKPLDFDHELIKESKSPVTVNENGRSKRITKHNVVVKQLLKQAMTGNISAAKVYLSHYQRVLEKATLSAVQQPNVPIESKDPKDLSDEELQWIINQFRKNAEQVSGKGHLSHRESTAMSAATASNTRSDAVRNDCALPLPD